MKYGGSKEADEYNYFIEESPPLCPTSASFSFVRPLICSGEWRVRMASKRVLVELGNGVYGTHRRPWDTAVQGSGHMTTGIEQS